MVGPLLSAALADMAREKRRRTNQTDIEERERKTPHAARKDKKCFHEKLS